MYGDRYRPRHHMGGLCINDNDGMIYEVDNQECTSDDDEDINLRWIPYSEIRYNNVEKQNYCCYRNK